MQCSNAPRLGKFLCKYSRTNLDDVGECQADEDRRHKGSHTDPAHIQRIDCLRFGSSARNHQNQERDAHGSKAAQVAVDLWAPRILSPDATGLGMSARDTDWPGFCERSWNFDTFMY